MKDQKNGSSSVAQQKTTAQKQPYEKPRLGTVTLFADQVLGNCSDPFPSSCPTPDPSFS